MGTRPSNPTAVRKFLFITLRRLRQAHGVSREKAAQAIKSTVKTIEHIEVGRRLPTPLALEKLLQLYGVPERDDLYQDLLSRTKKGTDWWSRFDFDMDPSALPEWFKLFLALESEATEIAGWDAQVAPGLFQTPDYAAGVIRAGAAELADTEVSNRVELRMARQREVLEREGEPVTVWRVLHENALRLPVGGTEVLREQLEYLLELLERPNISMQVLPAEAGAHTGTEGAFSFLSFDPELDDPGLVHVDTHVRSIYYERPDELASYRNVLRRLHARALPPHDTPALLRQILKEL